MSTITSVSITGHTTASSPRPHILYTVTVNKSGQKSVVQRRYSEVRSLRSHSVHPLTNIQFTTLHQVLQDSFDLPPKRLLVTSFFPSAWADDAIIFERKTGLTEYLTKLITSPEYKFHTALHQFLLGEDTPTSTFNTDGGPNRVDFDLEDALPSTLPRSAAVKMANEAAAMGLKRPTGADALSLASALNENGVSAASTDKVSNAASATVAAASTGSGMHFASYYPGWSAWTNPPEQIDFSKFDILYFGESECTLADGRP